MITRSEHSRSRRYIWRLSVLCAAIALILPKSAGGQGGYGSMFTDFAGANGGQTAYTFLTLPVSARQLSTGLIAWPGVGDASDIPTAPAATAFIDRYRFSVSHLEWLMGLRKEYAGACIPILDVGTVGFYSQVFTYGRFDNARDIDERPSEFKAVDYSLGVSFARPLLHKTLAAGATASYVQSVLAGEPAASISCDLGLLYKPTYWLQGHLYGRHLGTPATYTRAREPQPTEIGLAIHASPFTTPVSLDDSLRDVRRLTPEASLGVAKLADGPVKAGIGVELRIVDQFFVRSGYEYRYGQKTSLAGLSAGVGLTLGGYGVDAGWKYQSRDFGSVWSATVRFETEELTPKTAIEYYRIAKRHYDHERNWLAVRFARRALNLNPNLWQAHSLLARIASRRRRRKGIEIGLIYAGNVNGNLAPRQIGQSSIGGIARAATAVQSLRNEYPLCLAVEVGNLMGESLTNEQAQAALTYTNAAGFDVFGVGPTDIAFGLERYQALAGRAARNPVCTNVAPPKGVRVSDAEFIRLGRYTVTVLNAIDPDIMPEVVGGLKIESLAEAVNRRLRSVSTHNDNLCVLIFHGSWQRLQAFLAEVNNIDIVVCGSLSQRFERPMTIGETIVLSAGAKGRHVGALTVRFRDEGSVLSHENRLVALTEEIKEDEVLNREVERAAPPSPKKTVDTTLVEAVRASTDGLFAFVSDRNGTPHIYLKVPRRHVDLPLTSGPDACRRPRLSLASRRMIFTMRNSTEGTEKVYAADLRAARSNPLPVKGKVDEIQFHPEGRWIYTVNTPPGDTAAHIRRTQGAHME
ncbi:MAG: PorV/PorQ family protein, partial [Chitinivibrionales bacterium]|nr:PorV/PorQ family protein [Chitinivibrionales bacterium]MBD3356791.1 PorV/PorQ family protein [Chitinivibrionales bacterium]